MAPRWVWTGAVTGLVMVGLAVVGGAVLLALGAADPPTAGPLQVDAGANEATAIRTPRPLPALENGLTLEIEAGLVDGPPDAGYGLGVWHCDGRRQWVFAVDGEGYAVWFGPDAGTPRPWFWFLHAHAAPTSNRLRLHLDDSSLTLYINQEIAWRGPHPAAMTPLCAWGLYVTEESRGGAVVQVEHARAWFNSD